jgi:hypothetical protein
MSPWELRWQFYSGSRVLGGATVKFREPKPLTTKLAQARSTGNTRNELLKWGDQKTRKGEKRGDGWVSINEENGEAEVEVQAMF